MLLDHQLTGNLILVFGFRKMTKIKQKQIFDYLCWNYSCNYFYMKSLLHSAEAATVGVLQERVFLEILRNSWKTPVIKKDTLTQVFSCEFCEISKNTFFSEHLWATASESIFFNLTFESLNYK